MLSCAFFPCLYLKSLNQNLKVKEKKKSTKETGKESL